MAVKPGYKMTEVGVIPDEWNVAKLGDHLASPPRYGLNAPAVQFSDLLPAYLRITDISDDGRLEKSQRVSVNSRQSNSYYLKDGDIVFARTGASVGKSYLYRQDDGPLVYAGFLICMTPDPERLLSAFLAVYVTTGQYWQWVRQMSMRSGQPGVNGKEYAQLPVPLPTLLEQRAIATALSDVDALIVSLDRLIAKKRDIKQAVMQQLLTGRTRLPGFSGEWEVKKLRDIVSTPITDGPHLTPKFLADGVPFLSVNNLVSNRIDFQAVRFISKADHVEFSKKCKPKNGDILFGKAASVGMVALVETDTELNIWSPLALIRVAHPTSARFVCYALQAGDVHRQIKLLTNASSQGNIGMGEIGLIEIPLPDSEEQIAIAAVLSDIDAELSALEARRTKTLAIKQGMMQELLTGRTRLI